MVGSEAEEQRWAIAQEYERKYWEYGWKKGYEKNGDIMSRARKRYRRFHQKIFEDVVQVPNTIRVLEVGCGPVPVIDYFQNAEKYAIDPLIDYYKLNYDLTRDIDYVRGIGEYLPFIPDFFDVIVTLNTLDHVRTPSKVLNELFRILKQKGVLYVSVNCYRLLTKRYRRFKETLRMGDVNHPHSFSLEDVEKLILNSRFKGAVILEGTHFGKGLARTEEKLERASQILKDAGFVAFMKSVFIAINAEIDKIVTRLISPFENKVSKRQLKRKQNFLFIITK
jgi:SAM-dependent methyltransferase